MAKTAGDDVLLNCRRKRLAQANNTFVTFTTHNNSGTKATHTLARARALSPPTPQKLWQGYGEK